MCWRDTLSNEDWWAQFRAEAAIHELLHPQVAPEAPMTNAPTDPPGPLGEAGARLRALVAQWREKAQPHLGAAGDEAEWAACRLLCAHELETELEALLSAPVVSPPLPVCKECGCQIGGGEYCYEHKPYTVTPLKDGTFRVDRFGVRRISFEEPPSAPICHSGRRGAMPVEDEKDFARGQKMEMREGRRTASQTGR